MIVTIILVCLTLPVVALTVAVLLNGRCSMKHVPKSLSSDPDSLPPKIVMLAILASYILWILLSCGILTSRKTQTIVTVPVYERAQYYRIR